MTVPPTSSPPQSSEQNQNPKKPFPILLILGILAGGMCLCLALIAAVLFPVFSQARVAAQKSMALSEMKQLAVSTLIYVSDNNDRFPIPMSRPVLLEISDKSHQFKLLKQSGLEANPELSGKVITTIERPDIVWMARFSNDRIGPSPIAAFVDGSAKVQVETE